MLPSCECFHICDTLSAFEFQLRLPIIHSRASPWYAYLLRVYAADVPLPFDVGQLELFYPALLPTSMCGNNLPALPRCGAHDMACRGWLDPSRWQTPSEDGAKGGSHFHSPAHLAQEAVSQRAPFSQFVVMQEAVRWPAADNDWVEVTRMRPHLDQEGVGIGCWLYAARGSGVFVHVGRTRVFRTRHEAITTSGFGNATLEQVGRTIIGHDHNLARGAKALGYDSVQILYGNKNVIYGDAAHATDAASGLWRQGRGVRLGFQPMRELVLATRACMTEPALTQCVPEMTRTGWRATRPCHCAVEQPAVGVNCEAAGGAHAGTDQRGGGGGAKGMGVRANGSDNGRFHCVPGRNFVGGCSGDTCPLRMHTVTTCKQACRAQAGCAVAIFNRYHNCFLKGPKASSKFIDEPPGDHGTIGCVKIGVRVAARAVVPPSARPNPGSQLPAPGSRLPAPAVKAAEAEAAEVAVEHAVAAAAAVACRCAVPSASALLH